MSVNYDSALSWAKDYALKALSAVESKQANAGDVMAGALDGLNKAWSDFADALGRQRDERDRMISSLMDQLAEARKGR